MILCEFMDSDPVKREFLETMRGITSTVTVISAKKNSLQQAMTATSVASLSLEPPAMLVCINHEASIHETMRKGLFFCINVLTKNQKYIAEICSNKDKEDERFLEGNWSLLEDIPYNADSQSNLFCLCVETIEYKTHTIYIGEVSKVINKNISEPLLYREGSYLD